MIPATEDIIVAPASAPGPAARSIVRLGGPDCFRLLDGLFTSTNTNAKFRPGLLHLPGLHSPLPAFLLRQPGPHTYTGQDLAEIHLVGCPPLVDALIAELLNRGARTAQPGEFTLRGFLAGKRDLTQSEAVLAVVGARDRAELTQALGQLAGGVAQPLAALREDLFNLVADVEAGLDFADEKIEFVDNSALLLRLGRGIAQLLNLRRQLEDRAVGGPAFRVALVGPPNAGKSSLFNALVGSGASIVSPQAGTTRDYVARPVKLGGHNVELVDTAGREEAEDTIGEQAQELGRRQAADAELSVECIDIDLFDGRMPDDPPGRLTVLTKCDTRPPIAGIPNTSSRTGLGLKALKEAISGRAAAHFHPALAPSLSRCRHHVDRCIAHLRNAHTDALTGDAPEIVAAEARMALDELGEMTGAVHTEDLLGRIFSRFCVGK